MDRAIHAAFGVFMMGVGTALGRLLWEAGSESPAIGVPMGIALAAVLVAGFCVWLQTGRNIWKRQP